MEKVNKAAAMRGGPECVKRTVPATQILHYVQDDSETIVILSEAKDLYV